LQLRAVFCHVDIGVGHKHDQVVAHVFHLNTDARAQAGVPLLLHGRLNDLVNMPLVDPEAQIERSMAVKGLFGEGRHWNTVAEQHSLHCFASEEAFDIRADHLDGYLAESTRDRHVKHLVDRVVKKFLHRFTLHFALSFHSLESLRVNSDDFSRGYDEGVACDAYKECVRAG